ncbi:MAG: TonB-dependent receptor plug domain-containing protein, partial [Gammaproteobacteria bacterium]|nr:TonB-dependent receptor plug domain-containing protein [Gammaproteobacteria bacterium]
MTISKNSVPHMAGRALGFLAVLVVALGIPVSQAQAQKKEDQEKEDQAEGIQEVVVTTRRREEKLKEVPLSITAFNADMIEAAGITSLTDVAEMTPGLSFFNPLGEQLPVPVIRGIVPQDIFGTNAAAVFVDGVYVAGRAGLNFSQLDIERIEVVKGPQSAMYGRNAFSGAINYVTKKPTSDFESKTSVEAGNRGKQLVQASVSGPVLGDTLFGRVAGLYDEWDGSYDNSIQGGGGDDIGGYSYRSFQGALRWVPAETLEVNSSLYYSNDGIDESAVAGLPANCEDQVETTVAHRDNEPYTRFQNVCGEVPKLASLPDALDLNN